MGSNNQAYTTQPYRPPIMGPGLPQNFGPPTALQFRPVVPVPQSMQLTPAPGQRYSSLGPGMPTTIDGTPAGQAQFCPQQFPSGIGQPLQCQPSSQGMPMPYIEPNGPVASAAMLTQPNLQPVNSHLPNLGGVGAPISSSYSFTTSYGQINSAPRFQYCPVSLPQTPAIPSGGTQPIVPVMQSAQNPVIATSTAPVALQPDIRVLSDWQEHTSADGKRYYYNKKTRQSSWEKPFELMTITERADASTDWKEFTTTDGRKYFYNKVTKQSKWTMPEEVKLARAKIETSTQTIETKIAVTSPRPISATSIQLTSSAATSYTTAPAKDIVQECSPVIGKPVPSSDDVSNPAEVTSKSPTLSVVPPTEISSSSTPVASSGLNASVNSPSTISASANTSPLGATVNTTKSTLEDVTSSDIATIQDNSSTKNLKEAKRTMPATGPINTTPLQEKKVNEESAACVNKEEAKNAFRALLESANIPYDWTWEQAMRVIINDKRYGVLKSLGEKKQTFNEFVSQKKKQEIDERRMRQKKARDDFMAMLEESKELSSSVRWSKAIAIFEGDERFSAVERSRDREDLFETFIADLQKKEKAKAARDHKQHVSEYKSFLKSCEFIKANTQWRKVQNRLEEDERCSRLDKFDRLKIFQEYVQDLDKEEEEQRKIQKDLLRREERKNRDDFRKLMEDHVSNGILTVKSHWREYCMKIKDMPIYLAVASNTSGATPKDLFEDVIEELEKQYHDDKAEIKSLMKSGKLTLTCKSTFEDFKSAVSEDTSLQRISEINLKLVYDELLERLNEKEKEVKKRQRLSDKFFDLLFTIRDISPSSSWEDCKALFEDREEYRAISDDNLRKEAFSKYITHLQEKAKERQREEDEKVKKERNREDKEKRKEKDRNEKERERYREKERDIESGSGEVRDSQSSKEGKRKGKEKKHRRHHHRSDDANSDHEDLEESRKSRRHSSSDRKKSRKHGYSTESDTESRHKRNKKDQDQFAVSTANDELEDGELGEEGEIH